MEENLNKWIDFLEPSKLKDNLISCSLYIAAFESFKDHIIHEVKGFYICGFDENGEKISSNYKTRVLSKNKNRLNASLLWLIEAGAIDQNDYDSFVEIIKYRNKLAHEMMQLLFDGIEELPAKLSKLIAMEIKIKKWWILNIEIPTNPDFDNMPEIKEEDIITSSQIIYKILLDMLSGNDKEALFYREEFIKERDKNKGAK